VVSDAPPLDPNYAKNFADELVATLFELESEGGLRVVRSAQEIESCLDSAELAAILHFEGVENLGPGPGARGTLRGGTALRRARVEQAQRLRPWCSFQVSITNDDSGM
jgi:ketosteroid isomerase-like protein